MSRRMTDFRRKKICGKRHPMIGSLREGGKKTFAFPLHKAIKNQSHRVTEP